MFPSAHRKRQGVASRSGSGVVPAPRAAQIRASISDAPTARSSQGEESGRQPLSQSLPLGTAINAMLPKKKRQNSKDLLEGDDPRGRPSVSFAHKSESAKKVSERSPNGDRAEKEKKKSGGLGGVFKRGLASIKSGSSDEKRHQREEQERERQQSQSWSGALSSHRDNSAWIHPSGRTSNASQNHSSRQFFSHPTASRKNSSTNIGSKPPSIDERGLPLPASGSSEVLVDDDGSRKEGKGWSGVPEDSVAMVIPIESEGPNGPAGMTSLVGTPGSDGHRQALLVWFVPFNSEGDKEDRPSLTTLSSTASSLPTSTTSADQTNSSSSSSLPKFQKLLRRRASREKEGLRPGPAPTTAPSPHVSFTSDISCRHHPLPFRSFRIVARVVDWDDLRLDLATTPNVSNSFAFDQWAEKNRTAAVAPSTGGRTTSTEEGSGSSHASPLRAQDTLPGTSDAASTSTAPTSTIMAGRTFPTVIAVCHSRSQGVEFVLEGLDRLGFCQGESAWGPTGYEEWRGSGLSEKGRELLDLLWAGCVAVLGIAV